MQAKIQTRLEISLMAALTAVLLVFSASASVPGQVNYQGLLLDDLGDPITGPVDMAFSLFSDPTGGSPLWTEDHDAVDVLDGVYEVELGSTTPITPALLAGAAVYLEIEVEGETLTPRQRLLAVPYALQAESVGAFTAEAATQMYENFAFDGGNPPNDHPSEGLADVDGDGRANFLDADNDGDGLSDTVELGQGTDINLITPSVTGFTPVLARTDKTTSIQVQGTSFDPGLSVVFGSESPAPQNLTSTTFDVDVGPQAAGNPLVTVSNPNGEQDASNAFEFFVYTPTVTGFTPALARTDRTTSVQVQGTNFDPGLSVVFGSESPTPQNLTSTTFDVDVGPQAAGNPLVTVSNPSGGQGSSSAFEFFVYTPNITSVNPTSFRSCTPTSVHVQGTNFDTGLSVDVGSQSPTPTNLTDTDFDVVVGPQAAGLVDFTVTNPNTAADTVTDAIDLFSVTPTITGFDPLFAEPDETSVIQVQGTNFDPGITVTVGAETPTPTNVTPTSFDISVTLSQEVIVTVTNICGEQGTRGIGVTPFRRVFVSSVTFDSDLGGLAGADAKCAALATAAGLPGTYFAWLSDGVDDPDSRFQKSFVPYQLTSTDVIADDWTDLTDGTLDFPLTYDEYGNVVSDRVFSNVSPDGTAEDNVNHCNGWTAGGTNANFGRSISTSSQWTDWLAGTCDNPRRIFCFQQ